MTVLLLHAAMMSFVVPDLLGSLPTFKRVFAEPISKSRDRSATPEEQQLGQERSKYATLTWKGLLLSRKSYLHGHEKYIETESDVSL